MGTRRNERYPYHLARLVSRGLAERSIVPPSDNVLLKLFETLYFASLKTDEARQCRCTVNYMEPVTADADRPESAENRWSVIPFKAPRKFDVRSLLKLADAADPAAVSLAVFTGSDGELMIWGMVDQELRYGDRVALDAVEDPDRPGMFQATITGVGAIAAFKNYQMIGSLEQNNLISSYHDVFRKGPIFDRLKKNLAQTLALHLAGNSKVDNVLLEQLKAELLVRWHNSLCRILYNIQQYGHGGGLLIVPACPAPDLNVKYELTYDRLQKSHFRLSQHQIVRQQTQNHISAQCRTPEDLLRYQSHLAAMRSQQEVGQLREELLGCNRFVASLSRVDGFVLMDKSLTVHGFGVEARADDQIADIYIAGDASASPRMLNQVPLDQFGTRHRAMMRYCRRHEGSLGFVISQDGDIRAIVKHHNRLIFWENINVQLAYRTELQTSVDADGASSVKADMLNDWLHSPFGLRSA